MADEVEKFTTALLEESKESDCTWHVSFIGHSLGGLYARYCIGKLLERNFFDTFRPMVPILRFVQSWRT